MKPALVTAALLIISNAFMTIAWYGHLKFEKSTLWKVILVSWLIAFFEYCFQVPANRWGNMGGLSAGQLKVMQEAITLVVFAVFARLYLGTHLTWNYYVAFGFILCAVFFIFHKW
ncbi:MAG TPA: DMT family protein [Tepidisphaeraceae bacterium]|jgi:uncharacterized protein (DUF486 family)